MSKELEALKHIISGISNYTLHGIGDENWLGFQDVLSAVALIEQALRTPTADEVCEALSKYLGEIIIYNGGSFYNTRETAEVCAIGNLGSVYFGVHLPPHLINLISRFYMGVE